MHFEFLKRYLSTTKTMLNISTSHLFIERASIIIESRIRVNSYMSRSRKNDINLIPMFTRNFFHLDQPSDVMEKLLIGWRMWVFYSLVRGTLTSSIRLMLNEVKETIRITNRLFRRIRCRWRSWSNWMRNSLNMQMNESERKRSRRRYSWTGDHLIILVNLKFLMMEIEFDSVYYSCL